MRRWLFAAVAILMAIALTGCLGLFQSPSPPPPTNGSGADGVVELHFNWDQIDDKGSASGFSTMNVSLLNTLTATHIGARIVYPGENAFFAQSKTREAAETEGIISMQVPPSDEAHLYVAAIHHNPSADWTGQEVVEFGVVPDLNIEPNTVLVIEMDDVTWSEPEWTTVDPQDLVAIQLGDITADPDDISACTSHMGEPQECFDIPIEIHQPFVLDDDLIGVNGRSRSGTRVDAFTVQKSVVCVRSAVTKPSTSTCSFFPYLKADDFNLPGSPRLPLPPKFEEFTVHWPTD